MRSLIITALVLGGILTAFAADQPGIIKGSDEFEFIYRVQLQEKEMISSAQKRSTIMCSAGCVTINREPVGGEATRFTPAMREPETVPTFTLILLRWPGALVFPRVSQLAQPFPQTKTRARLKAIIVGPNFSPTDAGCRWTS